MYSGELRKHRFSGIHSIVPRCHSNARIPIPLLFQIFGESFRKKGGKRKEHLDAAHSIFCFCSGKGGGDAKEPKPEMVTDGFLTHTTKNPIHFKQKRKKKKYFNASSNCSFDCHKSFPPKKRIFLDFRFPN